MDAVRTSDSRVVALKQVKKSTHPREADLYRKFSMQGASGSDPLNHSVPVYDILQSPLEEDLIFIVMPYLRRIYEVMYATVGEVVECFRQLFEVLLYGCSVILLCLLILHYQGLQYMHSHHLAHRYELLSYLVPLLLLNVVQ